MTAAFILHIELSDTTPEALDLEAQFVNDTLVQNGLDVVSVEPWARPSSTPPPSLTDIASALPSNLLVANAADTLP